MTRFWSERELPASEEETVTADPPGGMIVQAHERMSLAVKVPMTPFVTMTPLSTAPS